MATEAYWRLPLTWNRQAARRRERFKVFCASLADVFEQRDDLIEPRWRVFATIFLTPWLDWQIVTKRAKEMREFLAAPNTPGLIQARACMLARPKDQAEWFMEHVMEWPLPNLWAIVSVENDEQAALRIPELLGTPAVVRGVSAEPLLENLDFIRIGHGDQRGLNALTGEFCYYGEEDGEVHSDWGPGLDWVIIGGETGSNARPCDPAWICSLVQQCREMGVACFVKQDSGSRPGKQGRIPDDIWAIKEFPHAVRS